MRKPERPWKEKFEAGTGIKMLKPWRWGEGRKPYYRYF